MEKSLLNDTPFALYDADDKVLIGIFKYAWIINRYLGVTNGTILSSAQRRGKFKESRYPGTVAVRYANSEQRKELGDELILIKNDNKLKFNKVLLAKYNSANIGNT